MSWIIGKVGMGCSWQLSWHASSAILAQGRRSQQAIKIFESFSRVCTHFIVANGGLLGASTLVSRVASCVSYMNDA